MGKTDLEKKLECDLILRKPGRDCLGKRHEELSKVMVMFSVSKGVWVAGGYAFYLSSSTVKHIDLLYFIVMHIYTKKRNISKY